MPIIPTYSRMRVGLSKYQKPPTLLSTYKNQGTHASQSNPAKLRGQAAASKMGRDIKSEDLDFINAPPLSSDDDDEPAPNPGSDSHDSESDVASNRRGEIKPTAFRRTPPLSQTSSSRRSIRDISKSSLRGKATNRSQDDEASGSAGSKRHAEDAAPKTDSHLTDSYGFAAKKKKTASRHYGSKSSQPRSSQPKSSQSRSSQKSASEPSAPQPSANSKFVKYADSPSPGRITASGFIKPDDLTPEKAKSSATFIKPPSSSPSQGRQRPVFKDYSSLSDESPAKGPPKPLDFDGKETAKPKRPARARANMRKRSPEPIEEYSQKPTFKSYASDGDDYLDDSDDKAIAALKYEDSGEEVGDLSIESPVAAASRCPMCHEVVDAELLAKHSDHGRMNIRKQAAFCKLHKRQTALDSMSQKGYPKVDWEKLDDRCGKHDSFLRDILEGVQRSYYRDLLRGKVESGKNRTLLKTEDSLTPGYYGPRGLRAMTEHIMRTLSSVVRKRAVEDRLVSARGYTGYVQTVLVPELAVRLIMEDMSVAEADARKIMQDSTEVGELLYEDVGDVIAGLSDEED
ncbi:hypothetical protein GGR52DRAFT_542947 [Hypoxylon sp. FL1284]|nr:hypothetical protein GGR52DRAFT_542947 [Hypoxylon sp. FL1284]